jgi:hypothetical protein
VAPSPQFEPWVPPGRSKRVKMRTLIVTKLRRLLARPLPTVLCAVLIVVPHCPGLTWGPVQGVEGKEPNE